MEKACIYAEKPLKIYDKREGIVCRPANGMNGDAERPASSKNDYVASWKNMKEIKLKIERSISQRDF